MLARLVGAGLAVIALGSAGPAAAQGVQNETLLVGLPEGFEVGYEAAGDRQEIHEFVPRGESVEEWSSMVTIQIFRNLKEVPGDLFATDMGNLWKGVCEGAAATKVSDGEDNGFPFVLWTFACPLNGQTGEPETMYFKGISGADAFYSIQYAFRQEPGDALDAVALPYLVGASACDTRKADRPCPEGM